MVLLWVVSVLTLLILIQCYQWIEGWDLPLPGLLILGGVLAIASNMGSLKLSRIAGKPEEKE
jgi:hypothetical protein